MQHTKPHAEHFLRFQQMPDVSLGITSACRTGTSLFDGPLIQLIFRIEKIDLAMVRIQMAVPAVSGRVHTVEKVNAALHALEDVGRRTDTHQIGRFILWQIWHCLLQNIIHLFMCLSDSQPADCITI